MRFIWFGLSRWARLGLMVGLVIVPAAPSFGQSDSLADLQRLSAQARQAYRAGDLSGAMALAQRIAQATASRFGDGHIRHAQALNNLALFQDLGGALDAASGNYQRAIAIVERSGESHRRLLADLKNNLAAVVLQQCRMREARSLYVDALKLTEANYGSYHPETEFVRANVDGLDRFAAGKASGVQAAEIARMLRACMS